VAHLVTLPDTPQATLAILAQAIRRGVPDAARPLLLVVVDPDDDELKQLTGLAARVEARPATPLHLLVAQTQPRSAGRELYAQLPALILGGGTGPTTLLPGQSDWPKRGEARLLGRGMRVAGRAMVLDEVAIAQALTPLRRPAIDRPPVLWDAAAPILASAAPTTSTTPTQIPNQSESGAAAVDAAQRKRRIAEVMARRRQALMDADLAAAPLGSDAPTTAAVPDVPPPAAVTEEATAPPADAGTPVMLDAPASTDVDAPTLADTLPALPDASTLVAPAPTLPVLADEPAPTDAPPISIAADLTPADEALTDPAPPDGAAAQRRARLLRSAHETGDASAPPLPMFVSRTSPPPSPPPLSAAPERPSDPAPMQEIENGWPIGPVPLGRVAMADLMNRVVAAPAIVAGQPSELGVTKNRLVEVLSGVPRAQARELAEILLAWFDQADLLVEPTRPGRLRHPRALVTTNLIEIAARLNATPCPDKAAVAALWAASNEGRN
jgi:hypothetical protein